MCEVNISEVSQNQKSQQDEMISISRGLLQGVDDLLAGRVYRGSDSPSPPNEPSTLDEARVLSKEESIHEEANRTDRRLESKTVKIVLQGMPDWLKEEVVVLPDASGSSGSDDSAKEEQSAASKDESDDDEKSSSEDFLNFSRRDILDGLEDTDDELKVMQAKAAQQHAAALLKKLNTDERVDLIEQVSAWYQRHFATAKKNIDSLSTQENFRDEVQRGFSQDLKSLRAAVSDKEMRALLKMDKFLNKLHHLGTKAANEGIGEHLMPGATRTDGKSEHLRRGTTMAFRDTYEQIQQRIQVVKELLPEQEGNVEEEQYAKPKIRKTKPSDLLHIISDQQDEIAALNVKTALTTQRLRTLQACAKFVQNLNELKKMGSRPQHASANGEFNDLLNEVKADVMRTKVRERMVKDATFCRAVWKGIEASCAKRSTSKGFKGGDEGDTPLAVEMRRRAKDDPEGEKKKRLLEAECSDLEQEIKWLQDMKHSGQVEEVEEEKVQNVLSDSFEAKSRQGKVPKSSSSSRGDGAYEGQHPPRSLQANLRDEQEDSRPTATSGPKGLEELGVGTLPAPAAAAAGVPGMPKGTARAQSVAQGVAAEPAAAASALPAVPAARTAGVVGTRGPGATSASGLVPEPLASCAGAPPPGAGAAPQKQQQQQQQQQRQRQQPQQQNPEEAARLRRLHVEQEELQRQAAQLEARLTKLQVQAPAAASPAAAAKAAPAATRVAAAGGAEARGPAAAPPAVAVAPASAGVTARASAAPAAAACGSAVGAAGGPSVVAAARPPHSGSASAQGSPAKSGEHSRRPSALEQKQREVQRAEDGNRQLQEQLRALDERIASARRAEAEVAAAAGAAVAAAAAAAEREAGEKQSSGDTLPRPPNGTTSQQELEKQTAAAPAQAREPTPRTQLNAACPSDAGPEPGKDGHCLRSPRPRATSAGGRALGSSSKSSPARNSPARSSPAQPSKGWDEDQAKDSEERSVVDDVQELQQMHREHLKLQQDILFMEEQIKTAKASSDTAQSIPQALVLEEMLGLQEMLNLQNDSEGSKVNPDLMQELSQKQEEVNKLRRAWWQAQAPAKAGACTAGPHRVNLEGPPSSASSSASGPSGFFRAVSSAIGRKRPASGPAGLVAGSSRHGAEEEAGSQAEAVPLRVEHLSPQQQGRDAPDGTLL